MLKTDVTTDLPAPLSLTLEEASKIAAGSAGLVLSSVESWWWNGQPAFRFVDQQSPVIAPSNVAVGQVAGQLVSR